MMGRATSEWGWPSVVRQGANMNALVNQKIQAGKREGFVAGAEWAAKELESATGMRGILGTAGQVAQEANRRYPENVEMVDAQIRRAEAETAHKQVMEKRELHSRLRGAYYDGYHAVNGTMFGYQIPMKIQREVRKRWPIEGEPPLPPETEEEKKMAIHKRVVDPAVDGYTPEEHDVVNMTGQAYQKEARRHFHEGASWAQKRIREKLPVFGRTIGRGSFAEYQASYVEIQAAAEKQFPIASRTRPRVRAFTPTGYMLAIYLRAEDASGTVQVRAYQDANCTAPTSMPPMDARLLHAVDDLIRNPTEKV